MGGPQKGSGRVRDNNVYYQKVVIVLNWQAIKNREVGSLPNSHRRRKHPIFQTPWYRSTKGNEQCPRK